MDAPPLQYVTTSDAYSIAYCVSGQGQPFVMMPCIVHSNIALSWNTPLYRSLYEALAGRFKLIQYDGRGTGNSTRTVRPDHTLEDCVLDLEAIVEYVHPEQFVLYADVFTIRTALQFAATHPREVRALIFVNPAPLEGEPLMAAWQSLYRDSWDTFINSFAATFMPPKSEDAAAYLHECVEQEAFQRLAAGAAGYTLLDVLPCVTSPILVLASKSPVNPRAGEVAKQLAAAVKGSRLVYFDGRRNGEILYSAGSGEPPVIAAIEDFLRESPTPDSAPLLSNGSGGYWPEAEYALSNRSGLSPRQAQVLRLIADGKTTQEIAETLVLSERTVQRHIADVYAKIGARNRAEATAFALNRLQA